MSRTKMQIKNNDDSKCPKLIAFLKLQNAGYNPTKVKTFTTEEIITFLLEGSAVFFYL